MGIHYTLNMLQGTRIEDQRSSLPAGETILNKLQNMARDSKLRPQNMAKDLKL